MFIRAELGRYIKNMESDVEQRRIGFRLRTELYDPKESVQT